MNNFEDFINNYPRYNKFDNDKDAFDVYNFLSQPNSIYKMIAANDEGKAALSGVVNELEASYSNSTTFDFKSSDFVKQCIGTMVKSIIEDFGYFPESKKKLPTGVSRYFFSATHYQKDISRARFEVKLNAEIIRVTND